MPPAIDRALEKIGVDYQHVSPVAWVLGLVVSLVMVIASIVAVRMAVIKTPADHFIRPPKRLPLATRILRTGLGVILIVSGLAMLILPGQGVLTIVIGLLLLDLPIHRRVALWIVARPKLRELIDAWRRKAGQPPFLLPEHDLSV